MMAHCMSAADCVPLDPDAAVDASHVIVSPLVVIFMGAFADSLLLS